MAKGRKTGGRKKGTPNKATAEIRDVARQHGPEVIEGLWGIFLNSQSEQARIAAGRELLDRGYGRPAQSMELTGKDGGPVEYSDTARDELARAIAGIAARIGAGSSDSPADR